MKNNKLLWILLPAGAVLIAAVCIVAALLVSSQMKSDKYYDQVRSARQYLTGGDYTQVVAAYEAAIKIKPENPEAYVELAGFYMDQGLYEEAGETASLGLAATKDSRLETLLAQIQEKLSVRGNDSDGSEEMMENYVAQGEDSEDLTLRYASIEVLSDFCYGELKENYGEPSASFISDTDGYELKFNGINGYAYFKNTEEYPDLINESTRVPDNQAKPYKYLILSPSWLFIGYEGYISNERLCLLFDEDARPVWDEDENTYFVTFNLAGMKIKIETDSAGNVYKDKPEIWAYPQELFKVSWEEETEGQTEESQPETFTLGSHTYTYDVTSIDIYGESLDLTPLSRCTQLRELILRDCTIDSLEPLSGCSSLVVLDLRGSAGFSDISPLAGLGQLLYVDLHSCRDVSDISPLMEMNLAVLHTCETGVSYEQTQEYKNRHPDCEVWYDNHTI